ncbi:MAG: CDP-alcohol phosphatidyltransferase family protein [Bacteroidales bacterium]|nr:CDP-alcohol phosphatidyltransferase family protein [Bacteroidales bacterium]
MKRHIPNLLTLGNLFCGVVAARMAAFGRFQEAAAFIVLGIVLDFFDGMAARILKVESPLGRELDSLADVVTSGVAPGFILFGLLWEHSTSTLIKYIAFLIPVFAAYRLAKFNLDETQHHSFRGLPAPANALFWAGVGVVSEICVSGLSFLPVLMKSIVGYGVWDSVFLPSDPTSTTMYNVTTLVVLAGVSLVLDILMVSRVPMFSLKFKNLSWKDNSLRYVFILICGVLLVFFGYAGIPLMIVWYIILSLCTTKRTLKADES